MKDDWTASSARPTVANPPIRKHRFCWTVGVLGLVFAVIAAGVGWAHRPRNVFERLMLHQWVFGPDLDQKSYGPYETFTCDPDLAGHRTVVEYWSEDPRLYVVIRAKADGPIYSSRECHTTLWKSLFPVWTRMEYAEMVDDEFGYHLEAEYNQASRVLIERVKVLDADGRLTDVPDVGAYLAERGVSADDLRDKMDWLLNQKVLPDFLPSFPGWGYSADDWGDVRVVQDDTLSQSR